ncbi:maleylpyruvate isomerase N-terminal domain-containing protein [Isoptericola sp. NPDC019571]|uniref:maleylpyruvate isomerase N-terminal domain-containing protein n=1 Tax=Isoptericola sp. NPDC019571 TaxID=3364008 RepID=UPI0037BDF0C7
MDAMASLARDSVLLVAAVHAAPADAEVPACPGWTADDLGFHVASVQSFWASVVGREPGTGLQAGDVVPPERPAGDAALAALLHDATAHLVAALAGRDPREPCWSWHPDGHTVGWVTRRQQHEALVHRVDAEQAAGRGVTPLDPEIAADGVDEVLDVLLGGHPGWTTFTPAGGAVAVVVDAPGEAPRRWDVELGRVRGTGPESGREYDVPGGRLVHPDGEPAGVVAGAAADLDLWLWGRGTAESLRVTGDAAAVEALRAAAADAMQ